MLPPVCTSRVGVTSALFLLDGKRGKRATTVKFVPVPGTETDRNHRFETRHQCMSAMGVYSRWCLEVGLRLLGEAGY